MTKNAITTTTTNTTLQKTSRGSGGIGVFCGERGGVEFEVTPLSAR